MSDPRIEVRRWNDWADPDFFMQGRQREQQLVPLFLRQILPEKFQQSKLTLTGWILVVVALGMGSAAYNTSSNILFMTLSLLLSSLVLSGILSYINFKRLTWMLRVPEHLQVGEVAMAEVALQNEKRVFPSMNLVFKVSSSVAAGERRLFLKQAVSAGESISLEWTFTPEQRGLFELSLHGVESKFPFGFLLKRMAGHVVKTVLVWPARAEYTFAPLAGGHLFRTGGTWPKAGVGSDLLNLRHYERGDSPRLIHWKASARMNKLMVRQLAQEGEDGFHLWLNVAHYGWKRAQFERLCSVACALAEDLFHKGRLETVRIDFGGAYAIRSLRDLHYFFDQLAGLEPEGSPLSSNSESGGEYRNLIYFKPCGEDGITIYVNSTEAGQA
jgi:uncharacterized protein (DUF58 family)